jgi:hypothetical protein
LLLDPSLGAGQSAVSRSSCGSRDRRACHRRDSISCSIWAWRVSNLDRASRSRGSRLSYIDSSCGQSNSRRSELVNITRETMDLNQI